MSLDDENWSSDEELDAFVELEWMTIKTSNINAVVDALGLKNVQEGNFGDLSDEMNTFLFPSQIKSDWIIIIYQWELRGSLEEYLNTIEQEVVSLSQQFGEAQSFATYEEHFRYIHWVLAQEGELIRSYAEASEETLSRNFGEITEAEQFIDWTEENLFLESREIIKVARQWSVEPIYSDHPENTVGIVGHKTLEVW